MAKYDFHQAYVGPLGPHLNCLSQYTLTRRDEDRLRGESIHPRTRHYADEKSNTCKQPSAERRQRVAAAIAAHLERHPNDKQSEAHLAWLAAA